MQLFRLVLASAAAVFTAVLALSSDVSVECISMGSCYKWRMDVADACTRQLEYSDLTYDDGGVDITYFQDSTAKPVLSCICAQKNLASRFTAACGSCLASGTYLSEIEAGFSKCSNAAIPKAYSWKVPAAGMVIVGTLLSVL